MTDRQLQILQHALGLDQYGQGAMYRNHFVGGESECRPLVALGYMTEHRASELTGGDPLFRMFSESPKMSAASSSVPPSSSTSVARVCRKR